MTAAGAVGRVVSIMTMAKASMVSDVRTIRNGKWAISDGKVKEVIRNEGFCEGPEGGNERRTNGQFFEGTAG